RVRDARRGFGRFRPGGADGRRPARALLRHARCRDRGPPRSDLPPHGQPRALPLLQSVRRQELDRVRLRRSRPARGCRVRIARTLILLVGVAVFAGPIVLGLGHLARVPWGMALFNSLVIAISFTALSTASAALAGFAFARRRVW